MGTVTDHHFSQRCSQLLDDLGDDGIVITRAGKPYAKVTRVEQEPSVAQPKNVNHLYGSLRDKIKINGDIDSPAHPWDPDKYAQS